MTADRLRRLVDEPGPFVSVCLDVSHDTEDVTTRNELRWRAAAEDLAARGADPDTVDAVAAAVLGDPAVGQAGRAVIAAHGDPLVVRDLPQPPAADIVRFSALPHLLPVLAAASPGVPHVVVLADKVGGDVRAVDRDGTVAPVDGTRGSDHPVHRVSGGGRAHGSMENRAEETVRQNARDVAGLVKRHADLVGAELVVLAGTVEGRAAIHGQLPEHVWRLVTEVDIDAGHHDLDSPELTAEVDRLVAQRRAELDAAAVDKLHEGQAHGTACTGLGAVTTALRSGAVDTLLITDPVLADRTVLVGADPTQLGTSRADLTDQADGLVEQRADEAVPLAAVATSAAVLLLTGETEVPDGVAALLRF